MTRLTKFEVARLVGLRALQLENGASQLVDVREESLRHDLIYVATLELEQGKLDFLLRRSYPMNVTREVEGTFLTLPAEVQTILATKKRDR